ncbi:hypothetical protein, partial [Neobacillus jeddahensis]|uniref:hypothetical protein n=1 Tax=Neobacillus jeddahensis TaxID=1461580 RepID=UPI0005A8FB49
MSWILRIIYKIENPRVKAKFKYMLINYPSHFLTILSTFLFIYAVYVIFTLKSLTNIPIENVSIFFNVIKVGIGLSCFFVVISRNKLKNNEYMFFYLNSNAKAYQFILGTALHLYIFYCFILLFLFTPVLMNILIEIGKINIFFISYLFFILTFIFLLTITIWTLLSVFLTKITKSKNESLFLNAIFLLLVMFGSEFFIENYFKDYLI